MLQLAAPVEEGGSMTRYGVLQAGNLPRRPAEFVEWGTERQVFRRVGGEVRFCNLIQQHLADNSVGELV